MLIWAESRWVRIEKSAMDFKCFLVKRESPPECAVAKDPTVVTWPRSFSDRHHAKCRTSEQRDALLDKQEKRKTENDQKQ